MMGAVAAATDSVRTIHELNRLAVELKPWANRPSVKELNQALPTL